jgi:transposase
MAHLGGEDRSQILLLPESLDDYVAPENPVRFMDAFVDGLDLSAAGFGRVQPHETGRPGYAPADLLKLYIYGYLNRIRSSRRLEAEDPSQRRGDLVAAAPEARLQDHRRFPP